MTTSSSNKFLISFLFKHSDDILIASILCMCESILSILILDLVICTMAQELTNDVRKVISGSFHSSLILQVSVSSMGEQELETGEVSTGCSLHERCPLIVTSDIDVHFVLDEC